MAYRHTPDMTPMPLSSHIPRVAFIGAGSVVFTRDLLADLLRFPELRGIHVALHDIDPERLATAEATARQMARQVGAAPVVTTHPDRKGALEGADFVINMVQVGGIAATRTDFEVPARYRPSPTPSGSGGSSGTCAPACCSRSSPTTC